MELLAEKSQDAGLEKHVPVIEATTDGIIVKVGAIAHPMEEAHFIEWIEVLTEDKIYRQYLKPGEAPEAEFPVKAEGVTARAYCNLHSLWRSA